MPESSILAVRNLAKRYGGVTALQGMNLRVERGAIHAVVGENGAGKSTLMKALAGVVQPDSGTEASCCSVRRSCRNVGLCDRILVIYQGRMVGELTGREIESGTALHLINTGEAPRSANSEHD